MKLKAKILIFTIIVIYLTVGYISVNNLNLYTPDSTRYYIWAQSLSKLEGFKDNTMPEPKRYVIHAPLYSLLMTPVALIFPDNLIAIKLATIFIACLGLFLFFKFLKYLLNSTIATYGTFILSINPLFFLLSGELLSDVPFIVLLIGIFLYFTKLNNNEHSNSEKLAFSFMITAAVLSREIGISLMLSSVIYFSYRKKYQMALTILIISLLFYSLWLLRNEYIVARFELPDLTNSKIWTYHFFTTSDSSLITEYFTRIKHNFVTYFSKIIGLIFYPMYETTQYDVVFRKEGLVAHIESILNIFKIPLAFIIWGLIFLGSLKKNNNSNLYNYINLFILLYLLIILTYPINDIRFLLPILIILILYFLNGALKTIQMLKHKFSHTLVNSMILLLGVIILIPNIVWTSEFIILSNNYMRNPLKFQKYIESKKFPPSHFMKSYEDAGKWIKDNSPENIVVMGMWKDLACWIEPRKLIIADYFISPSEFDYQIRDYGVEYLVSQTDRAGFNDFEIQMSQSKKYSFSLVKKLGRLNIYRINKAENKIIAESKTGLQKAISDLFDCKYKEVELTMDSLFNENPLNSKVIFYTAITKALSGKYYEAEKYFKILEEFAQMGMFLNQIRLHRQIIQLIIAGRIYPQQFSDYTTRTASNYWSLGYEKHAYNLLDSALNFDSTFIPAYIFKLHFALKQNKLFDARKALNKISQLDFTNELLEIYKNLISRNDSILNNYSGINLANSYLMNAKDYFSLGVNEDAIDNLLLCLELEPTNYEALKLLSDIYILKRRFAPAKKYLEKILQISPNEPMVQNKYQMVLKYF